MTLEQRKLFSFDPRTGETIVNSEGNDADKPESGKEGGEKANEKTSQTRQSRAVANRRTKKRSFGTHASWSAAKYD